MIFFYVHLKIFNLNYLLMPYRLKPTDDDWRSKQGDLYQVFHEALDKAFENTKEVRSDFTPTEISITAEGKTIPVEYPKVGGAEVSVDFAHQNEMSPDCPHVGWQTAGKRNKGAQRGHILLNFVPAGRNKNKDQ
jgi:hypothetical protein